MKEPMAMAKVKNTMVNVATAQENIEKQEQVVKWYKNRKTCHPCDKFQSMSAKRFAT